VKVPVGAGPRLRTVCLRATGRPAWAVTGIVRAEILLLAVLAVPFIILMAWPILRRWMKLRQNVARCLEVFRLPPSEEPAPPPEGPVLLPHRVIQDYWRLCAKYGERVTEEGLYGNHYANLRECEKSEQGKRICGRF
jgi:hypothetical protein